MSVVYQNPFGKKKYQPEVNGMRRWWTSTYDSMDIGGEYVWATEEGPHMAPDLRSRRSAARVERRRRRYLESIKRNTWEEVTENETETTPSVEVDVDAAVTAMNRYYSQGGYISTRTAFLHGLRAAGIPTTKNEEVRDE